MIYRMLTGPDDSSFCHKVSKALNEGWELYGSPTLAFDAGIGKMVCGQAVIKKNSVPYDQNRPLSDQ